ncbi:aminoglycoside adenylyltransferase domain-containing protein [Lactiplantibacillus herbarum]|uniref:aminoglycoside adenylyltransferase domain-containing protein n=1 Tax=Lactiplantibacillus herbarum TaxID=1670446 RepID=UPI00064FB8A0|nr:aminoglycoside adenylyltransferase domain-containing protein [Lactiplantibacillus herbarum]
MQRTEQLLQLLKTTYQDILKANLVGIYLHGSYALGSYNEKISDLDYVVVVHHQLTITEKQQLMTVTLDQLWPLAPQKGLEFHVLLLSATQHFIHPCSFDFHFSKYHYQHYQRNPERYLREMQGTDLDLAAHLTIMHAAGQVLVGPAIEEVFGPVSAIDYWDSIKFDVENAAIGIHDQPMYTILNLCRVLAYRQDGLILSKQTGGEWGLAHLPVQWQPLIHQALKSYAGQVSDEQWSLTELQDFSDSMLQRLGL